MKLHSYLNDTRSRKQDLILSISDSGQWKVDFWYYNGERPYYKHPKTCYIINKWIVWKGKYVFFVKISQHISFCLTSAPVAAEMVGHCAEPYIITIATRVGEKTHTEHRDPNWTLDTMQIISANEHSKNKSKHSQRIPTEAHSTLNSRKVCNTYSHTVQSANRCGTRWFPVKGFTGWVWGLVRRWVSQDDPQISTSIPTWEYPANSIPTDAPDRINPAPQTLCKHTNTSLLSE